MVLTPALWKWRQWTLSRCRVLVCYLMQNSIAKRDRVSVGTCLNSTDCVCCTI